MKSKIWENVSETWPSIVYLKDADRSKLDGFPYTVRSFRNMVTGKEKDRELAAKLFNVGKYLAITREDLVSHLTKITTRG